MALKEILENSTNDTHKPIIKTHIGSHEVKSVENETSDYLTVNTKSGSFLISKAHIIEIKLSDINTGFAYSQNAWSN